LKQIKPAPLSFTLDLPKNYRAQEILSFHARDPEQLAERITETSISKAIIINNHQALINVELLPHEAKCTFQTDDLDASLAPAQQIINGILGLTIAVESFERKMKLDALLGGLVLRQKGLRIPQAATPFEALTWAIIGQQINLRFAIQLRHTFIKLAGAKHSNGLYCYPDAALVCRLTVEQLTANKFSRAKAETLLRVANLVMEGALPLDTWLDTWPQSLLDIDAMHNALLNVKGIGPWTAHYALMRGFGVADCSLHGDVAVRKALAKTRGVDATAPTINEAEAILAAYAPYRSLVAAHLWASLHMSA
jgi:DNA-3-methyladenine glycosylase II